MVTHPRQSQELRVEQLSPAVAVAAAAAGQQLLRVEQLSLAVAVAAAAAAAAAQQLLSDHQLTPAVAVAAAAAQHLLSDHQLTPVAVPQRLDTRYKMLVL